MKPFLQSTILLALCCLPAFGADPPAPLPINIEAGKPVTVEVGKKCILTIETTAKKVTWRYPPGIDAVPLDGKRLAVWATPGVYTLVAQVPAGDDVLSTDVVLTVTGGLAPPPPVDQLVKDLQAAYDADTNPTKSKDIDNLASLLGSVVPAAKASGKIATEKDLQDTVHTATNLAIGANAIPGIRKAIGAYLVAKIGSKNAAVTDSFWATAATEYATVSNALTKVLKGGK